MRPGALRWTWASAYYDDTIAFYRDLVGLPVIGEFTSSFGEDGTIFGLPDTTVQLEIVRAHPGSVARGAFDQLVFYLDDAGAVAAATTSLRERGPEPDSEPHPYWAANGTVTYPDPDGRSVVFAPWVYGRDAGRVLVARRGPAVIGHLQLVATEPGAVELKNMAVVPELRGTGVRNLRFYQRCGFRFASVERDAFTPATGYPQPTSIDGIALRDRVWLTQELPGSQL